MVMLLADIKTKQDDIVWKGHDGLIVKADGCIGSLSVTRGVCVCVCVCVCQLKYSSHTLFTAGIKSSAKC